jgi:DNA invertase Pin-like site-specific DNA recombinase
MTPTPALQGLARCKKVLHYCAEWQQGFATMRFGYARVSTQEQDTALQIGALEAAGCERVFQEKASGGRWDRPELHRLFDHLRKGDVLVVWKLDRLSRSLKDLLLILEKLKGAGADFQSLTEAIDTATPAGRMMMQIVGSFAEFERAMLRERTRTGLDAARQEGRVGGRRPKLSPQQQKEVIDLVQSGRKTGADAARLFRVHPSTVARLLAKTTATAEHEQPGACRIRSAPSRSTCGNCVTASPTNVSDWIPPHWSKLALLVKRRNVRITNNTVIVPQATFRTKPISNSILLLLRQSVPLLLVHLDIRHHFLLLLVREQTKQLGYDRSHSHNHLFYWTFLLRIGARKSSIHVFPMRFFFVAFSRAGRLSLGHAAAPDRPRPRCPLHHL